jgi:hypothetical protein
MWRVLTPAWLAGHLITAATVTGFLALGWWQVTRAAAGNLLSYAYAVEWPVFAGFVLAVWVRELRRALRRDPGAAGAVAGAAAGPPGAQPQRITPKPPNRRRPVAAPLAAAVEEADPELAAYNHYLGWLAANPGRRPSEYPGA